MRSNGGGSLPRWIRWEEADELQLRGHEAEAAREPVPRQEHVCHRRRLLRARLSRRGEPNRRRGKLREAPLDRS